MNFFEKQEKNEKINYMNYFPINLTYLVWL
jgi:hypothetical protein